MIIRFILILITFCFLGNSVGAQHTDGIEAFDLSLKRLNSIEKLNNYIDSCAQVKSIRKPSKEEVFLVNNVIERKFYHGYSEYSINDNWVAYLAGKFIWNHLSAIVIPEDLVKYDMAACSQQAIVMMDVLIKRGYQVRKLGLEGHFILEVFYNDNWHVFDPNKEVKYQGISHDSLQTFLSNGYLNESYKRTETPDKIKKIFSKRSVGKVDEFPAKNARAFHLLTGFISQNFFPLTLLIISIVYLHFKKNKKLKLLKKKEILKKANSSVFATLLF